jgi:hypothetical protein
MTSEHDVHHDLDHNTAASVDESTQLHHISMKNQQLQVITNTVQHTLESVDHYDSAWKVEGMHHKGIVLTCMYSLDQDKDLAGGEVLMQREFL